MAIILTIANQKGGVGKTTTSVNLAAGLARHGKRVLLVDLDPQGNATMGSGIDKRRLERSLYHVLIGHSDVRSASLDSEVGGYRVLPANRELAGAEIELVDLDAREGRLRSALQEVQDDFDFILIDAPPSLSILTLNGLCAANGVIIPMQCEYFALEGLSDLVNTIRKVHANFNTSIKIIGILRVMFDRRMTLSQQVSAQLEAHFKDKVFTAVVPRNVRLAEAPSHGMPGVVFDESSRGAQAYLQFAEELIRKVPMFGGQAMAIGPSTAAGPAAPATAPRPAQQSTPDASSPVATSSMTAEAAPSTGTTSPTVEAASSTGTTSPTVEAASSAVPTSSTATAPAAPDAAAEAKAKATSQRDATTETSPDVTPESQSYSDPGESDEAVPRQALSADSHDGSEGPDTSLESASEQPYGTAPSTGNPGGDGHTTQANEQPPGSDVPRPSTGETPDACGDAGPYSGALPEGSDVPISHPSSHRQAGADDLARRGEPSRAVMDEQIRAATDEPSRTSPPEPSLESFHPTPAAVSAHLSPDAGLESNPGEKAARSSEPWQPPTSEPPQVSPPPGPGFALITPSFAPIDPYRRADKTPLPRSAPSASTHFSGPDLSYSGLATNREQGFISPSYRPSGLQASYEDQGNTVALIREAGRFALRKVGVHFDADQRRAEATTAPDGWAGQGGGRASAEDSADHRDAAPSQAAGTSISISTQPSNE